MSNKEMNKKWSCEQMKKCKRKQPGKQFGKQINK